MMIKKTINKKAREALLYLLGLQSEPFTAQKLSRVVYFVEREAILRGGEPIIGCKLFFEEGEPGADFMQIVSEDYFGFVITEKNDKLYISAAIHQKLYNELSDFDIALIREVYDKLRYYPDDLPRDFFRSILPEYICEEVSKSVELTYSRLLQRNGYSEKEAAEIVADIEYGKTLTASTADH